LVPAHDLARTLWFHGRLHAKRGYRKMGIFYKISGLAVKQNGHLIEKPNLRQPPIVFKKQPLFYFSDRAETLIGVSHRIDHRAAESFINLRRLHKFSLFIYSL
jgi:hypothetical protein